MKIFTHFSFVSFSNSYLVGPAEGGDAIMIDPGIMDVPLLRLIEKNSYTVRYLLVTHNHESHIRGGRTLLKIYPAEVFGGSPNLLERDSTLLKDGDTLDLGGITIESLQISGHSSDSMVYRIGSCFFTGDVLSAGGIGSTPNRYARALLIQGIQQKLLTFSKGTVYPGHGPPSTIEAERRFNPFLQKDPG
ncbi:MBL fold metallo-hydrolase [Marispirochaeta aestuarii]|uniref:MBL fold metallo-hydrolase n=1 Tax=Marispirochaeta aestuarii TaxID=1963862 RepID=UPI0029C74249|nr:MBL fold metallo-hydrolase [Marispirochaeta aestuarii]